ncbi:hypothetical protein GO003_004375 [Methylicorpusculum oleiharenae]|uniref:hypothetical protein n=1 Tax=Methylicorpusculum oleiharenae TaxID=1338687 RepID=UPI001359E013|nr:hypothetical protein [Methylicorpusculum oleiharenae]MCD2449622.1 hypothetical protein [Methylicorpusculum oleiharenae]
MLDCLRQAVSKTLERKRRLGQYVVQWNGKAPFAIGAVRNLTQPSPTFGWAVALARSNRLSGFYLVPKLQLGNA